MNVNSLLGKVYSNAGKLGGLYGVLEPIAEGRNLDTLLQNIEMALNNVDISAALRWITDPKMYMMTGGRVIKTAVIAYLAGEGLEVFGMSRQGKAAKNFATGSVMALPIAMAVLGLGRDYPGSGGFGSSGNNVPASYGY